MNDLIAATNKKEKESQKYATANVLKGPFNTVSSVYVTPHCVVSNDSFSDFGILHFEVVIGGCNWSSFDR